MELDDRHIQVLDTLAANPEGSHFNELKRITGLPAKTLTKKKEELVKWNMIHLHGRGKRGKKIYQIIEKGLQYLTKHNIRIRYGLVGLKWAEEAWKNGYKIRFLSDFTNLGGHDKLLLAWHPKTGDVRIAEIFGVGEFNPSLEGPEYRGQYVDRKVKSDAPVRSASLRQFINDNVDDLRNDREIAKVVKRFYEEHNSFTAVLMPKEISFGFPKKTKDRVQEIGRFCSLMFVGFKGEGDMPFIERMNIMAGGFNLSENLKLMLNYDVNLIALYSYAWFMVKRQIDPNSVNPKQLETWLRKTWFTGFNPQITIACKNADKNGYCRKLNKKCIALENREGKPYLNFRKCQILLNDVKQVMFLG